MCVRGVGPGYGKVRLARGETARTKTEAEKAVLDKIRSLGLCPANFEWLKCDGGYRCAGGSNFITQAQLDSM